MTRHRKSTSRTQSNIEETRRPDTPELEGGTPLPEELTGRASATTEDLTTLFANDSADHLADGFRGGSGSDTDSGLQNDDETHLESDDLS